MNFVKEAASYAERVAARARAARMEVGMTMEGLTQRTGIGVSYLAKIERGHAPLTFEQLYVIATALNRPIGWFLADAETTTSSVSTPHAAQTPAQTPTPPAPAVAPPEPIPIDPTRISDPAEKKLISAFRAMRGKERRFLLLLAEEMPQLRDRRYDERARKRPPNWARPADAPPPPSRAAPTS